MQDFTCNSFVCKILRGTKFPVPLFSRFCVEHRGGGGRKHGLYDMYGFCIHAIHIKSCGCNSLRGNFLHHSPLSHRMIRSSPTRRVTLSRSRYSSNGIAYFLVIPKRSLNCGTLSFGVFPLLAMTCLRSASSASR